MVEAIVSIVCSMIVTGNYEGASKIKGKLRFIGDGRNGYDYKVAAVGNILQ